MGLKVTDLSVQIGSLKLANPVVAASGCFGYGVEYSDVIDLSLLGGVAVKGLFLAERQGHSPERIVETPAGMLNAIGLQGIGVHRFIKEQLPELRRHRAVVIVNICGSTLDEYVELARILSDVEGVAALELNISCPNIKEGGITFGSSLDGTYDVVSSVKKVTRFAVPTYTLYVRLLGIGLQQESPISYKALGRIETLEHHSKGRPHTNNLTH